MEGRHFVKNSDHCDDGGTFVYHRPGAPAAEGAHRQQPQEYHQGLSAHEAAAPTRQVPPRAQERQAVDSPAGGAAARQYYRAGAAGYPMGGAAKKASLTGKNRASKNLRINLLIGLVIAVLAVCIILAAVLPGLGGSGFAAVPAASRFASDSSSRQDTSRSGVEYTGAVLQETHDAGRAYVQETLFLGDSNTARLLEYSGVTGLTMNTCIGVESMGIQSVIGGALVRFEGYSRAYTMVEAVAVLQPRRVVITFGTNNIGGYSADTFAKQYEMVLLAINEAYPYADLIIGAVPPVDYYCSYSQLEMEIIEEYNEALTALAEKLDCKFLDWNEELTDASDGHAKPAYTVDDGVHISEQGAKTMIDYFRTHSYVTEDTRPKPLAAIPQRQAIPKQSSSSGSGGGIPAPPASSSSTTRAPASTPASQPQSVPADPAPPESTPPVAEPSAPASQPDPAPGEEGTG